MIDAHCHLYDPAYAPGEIEEVINRAKDSGVVAMICNGGGIATSQQAIHLSEKYPEVFATVGIHPEEQREIEELGRETVFKKLLELTKQPKVVAIGEAGLDFGKNVTEEEKKKQIDLFKLNMELAQEARLPLVVHNRNADEEVRYLLGGFSEKVQLHCFVSDSRHLDWAVSRGFYISVGGIITFKKGEELLNLVKLIPDSLLLTETDSPYLSPEPLRGRRNEPENVKIVVETAARVRSTTHEETARRTRLNACNLFNLPLAV